MIITVMNKDFDLIDIIDVYQSLIWNEHYDQYGDFELHTPYVPKIFSEITDDCYLGIDDSDNLMMCHFKEITTDPEDGDFMTFRGLSLESILCQRVIASFTTLAGSLEDGIKRLLDENVISPIDTKRKIPNFKFSYSNDPYIQSLTLDGQYLGDNLHDLISTLCVKNHIGFRIRVNTENQFVFQLYRGTDRSYNQNENSFVVFSPNYENLANSTFTDNREEERNAAIIAGEGEGSEQKILIIGSESGLSRREIYVDASYVTSKVDDTVMSSSEYDALLTQKGNEELSDKKRITEFEGTAEALQMYVLNRDFFLGDIVQIENEYGMESASRIVGIIRSHDDSGDTLLPKFAAIKET